MFLFEYIKINICEVKGHTLFLNKWIIMLFFQEENKIYHNV
jgi:hypothetical protein